MINFEAGSELLHNILLVIALGRLVVPRHPEQFHLSLLLFVNGEGALGMVELRAQLITREGILAGEQRATHVGEADDPEESDDWQQSDDTFDFIALVFLGYDESQLLSQHYFQIIIYF